MTTRVSIRYGGTGANTAEGARQALDVLPTSGGSFSGSLNVGSNLTVSSVLTANNRGIFGSGFDEHAAAKDIDVNSIVFGGIKDDNGPAEAMIINKSNGAVAYAEFIALNDTANQEQGWISIGVNSSEYNDPEYTLTGPDDGYLLFEAPEGTTANGDLIIGTGSYGQNNRIVLAAGGFEPQDAQLVIAPAELKTAEIVNSSLNANIAILTTANTHTFVANDLVVISSVGAPYDGTRTIIDVTSNTFNVSITSANIASAVVDPAGSAVESLPFNKGTVELTAQLYVGEDSRNTIVNADITLAQGHAIPLGVVVNNDGPGQVVMVNKSNGALAYTEYIAHNDVGNVEMGWVSFGINSSGYDDPEYPITKADDAYLLYEPPAGTTGDGDLIIGTGTNGTKNRLIFAAEGFDESNAQMIITPNESVRIAIDTDASSVNTGALQVVGGVGVQGSMYVQGNQTIQGDLIVNGSQIIQSIENLAAAGPISLLSDGNIANTWDQGLVGTYAVSKSSVTEDIEFKELANNSATLSTSNNHSFLAEDIVTVANVDATFDGTHRITGVTANTFSFYKLSNTVSKVSATGTATVDKATRYTGFAKRASDGVWRLFSNLGTRPEFNTNFDDANLVYDAITAGAGDFRGTLKLGSPNTATISYTDANNRTLTIPALGGDRTFAFLDQAQTFTAAQGFNNTVTATKFIPTGGDSTGNGLYLPSANKLAFSADGVERVSIDASGMVVNDGSNDYDFRVESDGVSHMLFVDGGTNTVGIGTNIPAANLHVQGSGVLTGNVGIGTTNPNQKLSVLGTMGVGASAGADAIYQREQAVTGSYLTVLHAGTGLTGTYPTVVTDETYGPHIIMAGGVLTNDFSGTIDINAYGKTGVATANYIRFSRRTGANTIAESLRITSGGNVGIGTTNPATTLHIDASGGGIVRVSRLGAGAGILQMEADGTDGAISSTNNTRFQTSSTERMRITTGGNVGIGTTNPERKVTIVGPSGGQGDQSGILLITDGTGVNTDHKMQFGIERGSYAWIQSVQPGNNLLPLVLNPSGAGVGIGTTNPRSPSILHITSTGAAFSGTATAGSNMHGITLAATTNENTMTGIWFGSGSAQGTHWSGIAGSRSDYVTDWSTHLSFYTHIKATTGLTDATEKMRITGEGNVYTTVGTPISYGSGETYEIWNDEQEYAITHSDANWKDMKTFVCSKSGNLKFKWSAFISSGAKYFGWRILQNGVQVAINSFAGGLDAGQSQQVHAYRRFVASIGPVAAGDTLVLQMVSTDGDAVPVTGVGQVLYAKEFRAYSTVPVGAPDNGRSLNVFGTNDSRGLTRKFSDGRYYYSDLKLIGSSFDNPVQNLVTLPSSGQTNAAILFKLSVAQGLFGGASGNMHEGMAVAMWTGSAWTLNVDTMVKRVGNLSNVGTLSWSGNTLQYTGNRGSNYDGYLLTLEAWQPTSLASNALIFHI